MPGRRSDSAIFGASTTVSTRSANGSVEPAVIW